MNKQEVAKLLTAISIIDNRVVGVETVEAWHSLVGDYDLDDAMRAVRWHFAESTDYLMPAHIVAGARRAKAERVKVEKRERLQLDAKEAERKAVPPPKCKHEISLLTCKPCLREQYGNE